MSKDWDRIAAGVAEEFSREDLGVERGALEWREGVVAVFGGGERYGEPMDELEPRESGLTEETDDILEAIRGTLADRGLETLGFGLSRDRSKWVILVRSDYPARLSAAVWQHYFNLWAEPQAALEDQILLMQAKLFRWLRVAGGKTRGRFRANIAARRPRRTRPRPRPRKQFDLN